MNSESDFLAAIAAGPGDELLYGAFADWLEERGDERAAWVRSPHVRRWMGETLGNPIPALIATLKAKKHALDARRAMPVIGAAIVPDLVALLGHEDRYVRLQAVWCLRKIGKPAAAAVPALLAALEDADREVREMASKALKAIGPAKGADRANLRDALSDCSPDVREEALAILGGMGAKEAVLGELLERLESGDAAARESAVLGLDMLADPATVGPLCRALSDPEPKVREAAAGCFRTLWQLGGDPAVAALRAALADPVAAVRRRAADMLGSIGKGATAAVDELLTMLRDDAETRGEAAQALGEIAAGDGRVLEALHAATRDEDLQTARHAAEAMGQWPSLPAASAEVLLALDRRLDLAQTIDDVLLVFAKLERPTRAVLAMLRRVVERSERPNVRGHYRIRCAARALGQMGPAAAVAVPELLIAARVGYEEAATALGRVGEAGVAALLWMLEDDEERVRQVAVNGLYGAGEAAAAALPWLRRRVREGADDWVKHVAMWTIRGIGPAAAEAIPDLIAQLGKDTKTANEARETLSAFQGALVPHVGALAALLRTPSRARAARLLAELAHRTADVLAPLRQALREPDAEVRRYAVAGLGQLRDAESVPDMLSLLRDADKDVRREAAVALGRMKAGDEATLAALRAAEADTDKRVRTAAAAALKKAARPQPEARVRRKRS